MQAFTQDGTPLTLIEPPLGKGGEGAVYRIKGHADKVAKIYADPAPHQRKIEAMASLSRQFESNDDLRHVAWPLGTLYADPAATQFAGFGMRKVDACASLDDLYEYPPSANAGIGTAEKLDLLVSLAGIADSLHRMGQVIGDFNNNNIPVLQGCHEVGLVDADSFHATIGGTTHRCTVCMSGYMAPELIRNVRKTTFEACTKPTFTRETDNFSLAVHVFRMLFNGCHPYYCQAVPAPNGSVPAPLPVEKRVERGETPFFTDVPGLKAPVYAPDVDMLPPYVKNLFMRAFVTGQHNPSARPSAREWKDALLRFKSELKRCGAQRTHGYWSHLGLCPYCAADARHDSSMRKSPSSASAPQTGGVAAPSQRVRPAAAVATVAKRAIPAGGGTSASGSAAAAATVKPTGPLFVSGHLTKGQYRVLVMALSAVEFILVCSIFPLAETAFTFVLGSYETWMAVVCGAACLGATWYYAATKATCDSPGSIALAMLAGLGGIALALAVMGIVSLVISLALTIVPTLLMGAFLLALLMGLLSN